MIFIDGQLTGARTKFSHPYSYDPILIGRYSVAEPNGTVYTDRLFTWDWRKHDDLCMKHFGDRGQYWSNRDPAKVEAFLREYLDTPGLTLCTITEYCNPASGFPYWRLDYHREKDAT